MELRQLKALLGVADHGSFSAAADALATVQSNISAHVARLERELGTSLVDRAAGCLTEEGEAVVARARRIGEELDALVADVAGLTHEVVGTVRVGMIGTTARWLVPQLLARAAASHPRLRLLVTDGNTTWLEPLLKSGRLDLALVHLPMAGDDLEAEPLFEEDLVLVAHRDERLARRHELQLSELASLPLLLPLPGTAFRDDLDAAIRPSGLVLSPRAEIDGVRLIASLTFDGHGPAVLPATAVPEHMRDDWCLIPVRGLPRRVVGVARRRRSLIPSPARALLSLLHELVASEETMPEGLHPIATATAGPPG